jgi:hypothetical protein
MRSTLDMIMFVQLKVQVCTIVTLVIQNYHILLVPLTLKIFYMFLVHQRIFFLFIDSLLIIMSLLSFIIFFYQGHKETKNYV